MANQRTEASKYASRYSPGGFCTAAQLVIEIICVNKAKSQGKDLPVKFWELDEWKKYFSSQTRRANSLLKKYGEIPLVRAFTTNPRGKKIYSLFPVWVEEIVAEESKKWAVEETKIEGGKAHDRVENPATPEKEYKNKLLAELD